MDADFADQLETSEPRKQHGQLTRQWREAGDGTWDLAFDYRAEHAYDHQGETGPALMKGALAELARWQGQTRNDWRDEGSGRMLHEAHTGPLAMLNFNPRRRYYGSVTTSAFYPVVVAELWHWTGDKALVRPFLEPALRGLRWLGEYGDLFSGWEIRTLSSEHPAYSPFSYHRGSVWPVEQGTFALAFLRYGLHGHARVLTRAQFEAAALFDFFRLPEVFSGHPRNADYPFPAFYAQGNSPQAWSASAVFSHLQALLGLYPYAPLNLLLVDPKLPDWLPEITVSNLHVGKAIVTIRFYRTKGEASDYEVLDVRGPLHVLRQPSPWSLTATYAERLKDALTSLLPGK